MPRILVAEDDPSIRSLITQLLRLEGHDVSEFSDGRSALDALKTSKTDLVVLDIMMPQLDGLALLNEIRADPETQTLPVVLLTAKADDATTWAGWSGGCDYYMTKPFEPDDLLSAVQRLCSKVGA
jgi:two-component system, sensor histidine kinase and response regulator